MSSSKEGPVAWLRRRLCRLAGHRPDREIEGSPYYFPRRCWCGSFRAEFAEPQRGSWNEGYRL